MGGRRRSDPSPLAREPGARHPPGRSVPAPRGFPRSSPDPRSSPARRGPGRRPAARIVPRRILPERVLGSRFTTRASLNAATGPIRSRTRATSSRRDLGLVARHPGLQHHEAERRLALQRVGRADHGAFRHVGVRGQHFLHRSGRQAVAGDVDDVVGAAHHPDVAVGIDRCRRRRCGTSRGSRRGRRDGSPRRRRHSVGAQPGGSGRRSARLPSDPRAQHRAVVIQRVQVVAGAGASARARLEREQPVAAEPGGDRPAGLGLPPVIDHRAAQQLGRPQRGRRIAALAGQIQRLERRQIVAAPAARPSGSCCLIARSAVGAVNSTFTLCCAQHPPERAGVRRADRLALVHHARCSRAAAARRRCSCGRPPSRRRRRSRTRPPRPARRSSASSSTAPPRARRCRARRPWVGRSFRMYRGYTADRWPRPTPGRCGAAAASAVVQVVVAPRGQRGAQRVALQDQAGLRLVRRQADGGIQQRLVGHHPARLQPAGGRNDHLGFGIRDPRGELGRGEAAEHHGMDRAQPGAGQHGDRRFRHHRHVDHHPVAAPHPERGERAGQLRGARQQRGVGEGLDPSGPSRCPRSAPAGRRARRRRGGRGS